MRHPRALWKIEDYIAANPRRAGIQTKFIHSRLPEQGGATVPGATAAAASKPEACTTLADLAKGTAILFADGLRFDLAQKLKTKLAEKGLQLELSWRWTALPTVTPTAKPAASPISELFTGDEGCEEFRPRIKDGGKDLTSDRFKQLLEERGCQVLSDKKLGQPDGVEKFVVTPELQSEDSIGSDPLPPGQIWTISPGGLDENAGLYRIEVTEGPGSGVKILNRPAPAPFSESERYAGQNLYSRAKQLTGEP